MRGSSKVGGNSFPAARGADLPTENRSGRRPSPAARRRRPDSARPRREGPGPRAGGGEAGRGRDRGSEMGGEEGEGEGTGKEVRERCVWKAKDQGIRNPVARLIRMQLTIKKKKQPKKQNPDCINLVSFSAEADNVKTH